MGSIQAYKGPCRLGCAAKGESVYSKESELNLVSAPSLCTYSQTKDNDRGEMDEHKDLFFKAVLCGVTLGC